MEMAGKQFSPLMEMVGKQFSPFMELLVQSCLMVCPDPVLRLVQPSLTACATASYGLWKWLASSSPIYGTACAIVSYDLCNPALQLVQQRLTAYGNG